MRGTGRSRASGGVGQVRPPVLTAVLLACALCAGLAAAAGCGGSVSPDGDSGPGSDAGQPEITGLEGTGPAQTVAPRPEDQAAFDNQVDKVVAGQRLDSDTRELVITGTGLSGTTAVSTAGQSGQGTIDFEIQAGGTDTMLRVRFPQVLAVAAGGLFLLTVTTPAGEASAQVFFLQGQDGQCSNTVAGDLTVNGNIVASGQISAGAPADCPAGYALDPASPVGTTVCVDAASGDEMVRVGDFWIDRYEVSIWSGADCSGTQYGETTTDDYPPASFPDNGNFSTPLYGCSVTGVTPSRMMTWFQAQAACAASGKHLCTNAEWQSAAEGTHDPDANLGLSPLCNTSDTGPRATGQAGGTPGGSGSCISMWGAEDMVGNLWEWTSDWWTAGPTWQTASGQSQCPSGCTYTEGWPSGYGSDATWSVNGEAHDGAGYVDGIPAAALRGGRWGDESRAGVFALALRNGPSYWATYGGARCCRQR